MVFDILVVDDDRMVREMMVNILQHDGHRVTAAEGGQAGINTFLEALDRGKEFDVVITDLGMPHVDGRRVAAAVKAASPATPVILFTGGGQQLMADETRAHVDRVLNKPPKLEDLRRTLVEVAGKGSSTPPQ